MFDKLRNAFSNAAKSLGEKELTEADIDDVLFDLEFALLDSDVASEVIDSIKGGLRARLVGLKVEKKSVSEFVRNDLIQSISALFDGAGTVDMLQKIRAKKESPDPYVILFVGINGTGKTTTVAKVAHMLMRSKISVAVAASDTFRAGAIEQLREHMKRLGLKLISQNYGADPAAVARDAVLYARSHKVNCVLIDTAGRMQTSRNLMEQITKITNVVNPDLTLFVGDALAGNDTVSQAREFYQHVKFNASILTKSDADARGGAALSIVKVTSTPVIFVGTGQEYGDLEPFDKDVFLRMVFGTLDNLDLEATPESARSSDATEYAREELSTPEAKNMLKQKEQGTLKVELDDEKTELEPEPKPKLQAAKVSKPKERVLDQLEAAVEKTESSDVFEGIETDDIARYSKLYDVAPPQDDQEAAQLAVKIKRWISDGRLAPGQKLKLQRGLLKTEAQDHKKPMMQRPPEDKESKKPEKAKKKRGFFSRFKQ